MYKQARYNLAIGLTLRQLHQERKLHRETIAEALEISEMAVSHIEQGAELLTAGGLILLLETLGMSWEDFIARVEGNLPAAHSQIL
jgi:transcriptional regulator with XRE-family HTH domain